VATTDSTALLESQQLLGAEALVMNLRGGFNEVLQVRTRQEVAEVDKFAMVLILDCYQLAMRNLSMWEMSYH